MSGISEQVKERAEEYLAQDFVENYAYGFEDGMRFALHNYPLLTDEQWEAELGKVADRIHESVTSESVEGRIDIHVYSGGISFEKVLAEAAMKALGFRRNQEPQP